MGKQVLNPDSVDSGGYNSLALNLPVLSTLQEQNEVLVVVYLGGSVYLFSLPKFVPRAAFKGMKFLYQSNFIPFFP
jgi:hypothetical protein